MTTSLEPSISYELIEELLNRSGVVANRDLCATMIATALSMGASQSDRLDLKIAGAALEEMAEAFKLFRPFRSYPKVTFFGSARTKNDDPLYARARALAGIMASHGWMVVTGAGPGIMAAATEGAGREMSIGVNIRLPFEQGANQFIAADTKLVEMRYFFTRKLMLMKESSAYVVMPGGFGTLDESFELLTLLQTGKAQPAPVVFLDTDESGYWDGWKHFLDKHVIADRRYVDEEDTNLFTITSSVEEAASTLLGFYRNYHSLRWVGDLLVLRLKVLPTHDELRNLNDSFGDICTEGRIHIIKPLPPERHDQDCLDLPRLAFKFDRLHYGRLRLFINALNNISALQEETPFSKVSRDQ